MKIFLRVTEWVIFIVLLCAIAVIASPFLLSRQSIASYSVVSGSMEPTIHIGTLTFVRQTQFSSLEKGDIIAFTDPTNKNRVVLHRIYSIKQTNGARVLQTKGDNNRYPDGWQVTSPMVRGKLFYAIPYVGNLSEWLKNPIGFGVMIGIPALLFIYLNFMQIRAGIKEEIAKGVAKNENKTHESSRILSILIAPIFAFALLVTLSPSIYALKFGHVTVAFAVSTTGTIVTPTPTTIPTPTSTPIPTPTPTVTPTPSQCGGDTTIEINGNGAGSNNNVSVTNECSTTIHQSNTTNSSTTVNTTTNTGGNSTSNNTSSTSTITTGSSISTTTINQTGSQNFSSQH